MEAMPRHQCLIYDGSPAKMLTTVAAQIKYKLDENMRCMYLNRPAMVAGIKSYLYAAGVDVQLAVDMSKLIFSSDYHSKDGIFDIDTMLETLKEAVSSALSDGY